MSRHSASRRRALQQLAGLTALGALNVLRLPCALAETTAEPPALPGIGGRVVHRGDPDYELWRQAMVWHMSKPERYPDVIVQAKSADDVAAAVRHAAGNDLKIAMRSGGHNSTGCSLRDGGMTIDVSAMGNIEIDTARRIASIQPGVRSLDLVLAARDKGLTFPVPHCPSVGLAGFTLGGGIGWNYPQRGGMSTHSITGAEVITADGQRRQVTLEETPDLYWAVRGVGPGFFGAITRLDLALYPAPGAILASTYILPLSEIAMVTETLDEIRAQHDVGRVEVLVVLVQHPGAPPDAPPEESKIVFITAFAFEDDEAAARQALVPFAASKLSSAAAASSEYQPFDFEGLYERFFSLNDPAGRCARYAVDNVLTNQGAKALEALAPHLARAPSRDSHVLAAFNMNTRARPDSCFSWEIDCYVGCYGIWDHEADDERMFTWLDAVGPLMEPFRDGRYVNEVEGRLHPERYRQCYPEENWNRLEALRRRYDPDGVFHTYLGLG